jgi:hypothetical protein
MKDAPSRSSRSVRPFTGTRSTPESGSNTRIAISIGAVRATPRAHPMKFNSDRLPSCRNAWGMVSHCEVATNRPSCSVTDPEPVNCDTFFVPHKTAGRTDRGRCVSPWRRVHGWINVAHCVWKGEFPADRGCVSSEPWRPNLNVVPTKWGDVRAHRQSYSSNKSPYAGRCWLVRFQSPWRCLRLASRCPWPSIYRCHNSSRPFSLLLRLVLTFRSCRADWAATDEVMQRHLRAGRRGARAFGLDEILPARGTEVSDAARTGLDLS